MTSLLPAGSVVLLKGGKKRVMIYGYKQVEKEGKDVWDYIGCPFPEGNIGPEYNILFNHDQIDGIFFLGCQDHEVILFHKALNEKLEE